MKSKGCILWRAVQAAAVLHAAAGLAFSQGVVLRAAARTAPTSPPKDRSKDVPLVNTDEDLTGFLAEAQRLLENREYARAVEILQALVLKRDSVFVPAGDGRRFVPMWVKANEVIGRMDPEGLRLYRALHDPAAKRMYEEAVESGDINRLRALACRYMHTGFGGRSLEALGSLHFDRGEFHLAAQCWRAASALHGDDGGKPLLLAKTAAALHLAGEATESAGAADELKAEFPDASARLGEVERNLVEFVAGVRALPPMERDGFGQAKGWLGIGALQGAQGRMDDCDVVLVPRWRKPDDGASTAESPSLIVRDVLPSPVRGGGPAGAGGARLRNGHVLASAAYGDGGRESVLPAMVHPVVVGETVIYRAGDAVVACDLVTGQEQWRSYSLPMYRDPKQPRGGVYYEGPDYGWRVGDSGRYALTVGGGKVYVLAGFKPSGRQVPRFVVGPVERADDADTSSLVALAIAQQGKLSWRVGDGYGDDEVVRNGKFLSAPACNAGRLFVLATYSENYYLLCLNADTGSLLWKSQVCQTPVVNAYGGYSANYLLEQGSPPSLADGRVFVLTNAGVLAAYDEQSGLPIWAYQYDSRIASSGAPYYVSSGYRSTYAPANPVLVSAGRVICLPCDGEKVLALSAQDGQLLWESSRQNRQCLSGIDAARVLLSGDDLVVLSAGDGKVLAGPFQAKGINGRPAVTLSAVLASGQGRFYRLDLPSGQAGPADYRLSVVELNSPDGLLGNLVSADGKLIAANAAGVCAYFTFEEARRRLDERLAGAATPQARTGILFHRGQLAFNARRFTEALEDFQACERLTGEAGDGTLSEQVRRWVYRAYVAIGNAAEEPGESLAMFEHALAVASSPQEAAHTKLRLAKFHEKLAGGKDGPERLAELKLAAALAQEISESCGEEELVDVEIGPAANESTRFDESRRTFRGKVLGQDFIGRLVEQWGQEPYADFDAAAREALDSARRGNDRQGMLAVAERWPRSVWADGALFAAAEATYKEALTKTGPETDALLQAVIRHLSAVASGSGDKPLRASASCALATIFARGGHAILARLLCEQARQYPPETEVAFAGICGKLGDLLKTIETGKLPPLPVQASSASTIRTPLRKVFSLEGEAVRVLRDQNYRPVRLGDRVFMMRGNRVVLADTTATSADAAVAWSGLTGVDVQEIRNVGTPMPGFSLVGGTNGSGTLLAVADRKSVSCLDIATAKMRWQKTVADLGMRAFHSMGIGEGALVMLDSDGNVVCVNLDTAETAWRASPGGQRRSPMTSPQIRGGMVLVTRGPSPCVTCYSMDSGKIVGQWESHAPVGALLADEGMIVTLVDGELAVREKAQAQKPVWRKRYDAGRSPAVLGVSGGWIVVQPDRQKAALEVLGLTGGGQVRATLEVADSSAAFPVDVACDGSSLYAVCSLTPTWQNSYRGIAYAQGLIVRKFDVASGRQLWKADLDAERGAYPYVLVPLVLGAEHVVLTTRQNRPEAPSFVYVLDSRTGQVADRIDLSGEQADAVTRARRLQVIGPPVMTNGRLCVETADGASVYAGQ